jgi:dipeptidyl aminopeptidase/acylaminoacyl peptidase
MPRFLFLMAAMACSTASAEPTAMTLDDIARLSQVSESVVSPSGQHVAYIRAIPRDPFSEEDGEAWAELHVLTQGRSAPRKFIRGQVNVAKLQWSPDEKGIFFLAKRGEDEHKALWVIPVDGGEAFAVCRLKADIDGYALHPDGLQIALLAKPAKPEAITSQEEKGFKAKVYEEDVHNRQLLLGRIGESDECNATALEIEGSVASAKFSPAGDRLLLAVTPTPLVDDGYMQTRLRIANLEGGIEQRIENLGKLGKAEWSPDGKRVAFIGVDDINDPRDGRLKIADPSNGEIRDLWPNLEAHIINLAWLNSDHIAALVHRGVESELVSVDALSGEYKTVSQDESRVIRSFTASADGKRIVAIADSPTGNRQLQGSRRPGPAGPADLSAGLPKGQTLPADRLCPRWPGITPVRWLADHLLIAHPGGRGRRVFCLRAELSWQYRPGRGVQQA